jgi:hypothetical protein
MALHVAYLGFTTARDAREYRLRAQDGAVFHDFVRAISLEAFAARRARYQDAPEICFLKLQDELAACESTLPEAYASLTDSDLDAYRIAHAPKAPRRRTPQPA